MKTRDGSWSPRKRDASWSRSNTWRVMKPLEHVMRHKAPRTRDVSWSPSNTWCIMKPIEHVMRHEALEHFKIL